MESQKKETPQEAWFFKKNENFNRSQRFKKTP